MTKEEKAVLTACKKRFDIYMRDSHLPTPEAVLTEIGNKDAVGTNLIRACAKWQIAVRNGKASHAK
jgi:hypothetical protein